MDDDEHPPRAGSDLKQLAKTKPRSLHPLAEDILDRLSSHPEASEVVLGGYFALQHYLPYRQTHDIDAWWKTRASLAAEGAIRVVMAEVADARGLQVHERSFGDTVSFELHDGKVKVFSFQIAVRSIALDEPLSSAWPPVLIETLHDNVGSKMNALVNRGAPRDLLDIKHLVDEGLITIEDSWRFWAEKNPGQPVESAKQNVLLSLEALAARRPLDGIVDPGERERARELREWYRHTFLASE